jgi:protoporphyrinogen oxidase
MRVGIIGAGATGLSAAYDLGRAGHQVTVFERAPFLGGQASTFDVGGARLERGYHHLFTGDTDILDLNEEIGLGRRMRFIDSKVGTLHGGSIYDFVTPMDLLKFKPLPLADRIRLGLVTMLVQRMKDWRKVEHVTASQWLRKWAGKSVYEVFWGPMLRGKFGQEFHDQVGMAWVWGKIHTRFASRQGLGKEMLGYPIGSFGEIFDTLVEQIEGHGGQIHIGAEVERILPSQGAGPRLEVKSPSGETNVAEFDAVLSTTQSHMFLRLAPDLPEDYRNKLADTRYLAAVLLILVLDRPLSRIYWLNVADRSIPFVGVIEHTNLIGPDHYGGRHIVYLSNYVSREDRLYGLDHEALLEEYLPHLAKINPEFERSWIQESYHHRVPAAQPIIGTRYSERLPDHRTPLRGVYLANTTQVYPEDRGTNYSVRMGRQVAATIMGDSVSAKNG